MASNPADALDPEPPLGVRQRNKLDKLARISLAARDVFESVGFDDATLREIARRADVGLGTLFSYAKDKRDLLFLIINDAVQEMTIEAAAAMDPNKPLMEQMMTLFRFHYDFFGQRPQLSRILLRELSFYKDTVQAARFEATRNYALSVVRGAIESEQRRGVLAADLDLMQWGRLIFGVYQMEIRDWLGRDTRDIGSGLTRLRNSLELLEQGLAPSRDPYGVEDVARPRRRVPQSGL